MLITDLSVNYFGFTDAYCLMEEEAATEFLRDGSITFEVRKDKTVEGMAARLMDTEGNLDKLQAAISLFYEKGKG